MKTAFFLLYYTIIVLLNIFLQKQEKEKQTIPRAMELPPLVLFLR